MNFFFDNNLPPKLADALQVALEPNHVVLALRRRFPAAIADWDYFRLLAEDEEQVEWIVIARDIRIGSHPHARRACYESGLRTYLLTGKPWGNLDFAQLHAALALLMPRIIAHVESNPEGRVYSIGRSKDRFSFHQQRFGGEATG